MKIKRIIALLCVAVLAVGMTAFADEVKTDTQAICVNGEKIESTYIKTEDSSIMVPVRIVCETLGFNVEWVAETKGVVVEKTPMYFTFNIDTDGYTLARTAPIKIGKAPVLIDSTTYVPVEFFADIMTLEVEIADDVLLINVPSEKVANKVVFNGIADDFLAVYDLRIGDVLVNISGDTIITEDAQTFEKGQILEIVYDDFMTMSLPPITNAVEVKKIEGETAEIINATVSSVVVEEGVNQIVVKDESGMETALNISDETVLMNLEGENAEIEAFATDKKISAVVSMASTRSLPPQRAAFAVRITE